jgi:hypothetical protein
LRFLAVLLTGLALIAPGAHLYELANKMALAKSEYAVVLTNLVIFYFFTYPVNRNTQNWTLLPDNWEALRTQWEYSHAVNAVVTFLAFCVSIAGALR